MTRHLSTPLYLARWLIGWMIAGPLLIGLDLVFHFLPDYPALKDVRAGPLVAKLAYVACAPVGLLTLYLVRRRPIAAFGLSLALPVMLVLSHLYLWQRLSWSTAIAVAAPFLIACDVFRPRPSSTDQEEQDA